MGSRAGFDAEDVRRYYDENTRLMLGLGHTSEGTIRRAVWGPGVTTRAEALAYVDGLILERALATAKANGADAPLRLLDLGCGVGASLCRMARQADVTGVGITISDVQAALAAERAEASGLGDSVRFVAGDFCDLPSDLAPADVAFCIEAFVHAPSAERFFAECARVVRPGGLLVVCDDFLGSSEPPGAKRSEPWLDRFRRGWVVSTLVTVEAATRLADDAGFSYDHTLDLTDWLELGRPRDLAIAALMRSFGWVPLRGQYWSMLRGGHALQVCLHERWIEHRVVVWRRKAEPSP